MALSGSEAITTNHSRLGQLPVDRLDGQAARERRSSKFFSAPPSRTSTRSPRRAEHARAELCGTAIAADAMPKSVIHPVDRMSNR